MSRVIDQERIDSGDLTKDEVLYLAQRDQLPEEFKKNAEVQLRLQNALGGKPPRLADVANTGTVNTLVVTKAELEAMGIEVQDDGLNPPEQFEDARVGERPPEMKGQVPAGGTATRAPLGEDLDDDDDEDDDDSDDDDDTEDGDEDYDGGWNNDQRRAELARRGLSVDGDKAALIARLVEDDNAQKLAGSSTPGPGEE